MQFSKSKLVCKKKEKHKKNSSIFQSNFKIRNNISNDPNAHVEMHAKYYRHDYDFLTLSNQFHIKYSSTFSAAQLVSVSELQVCIGAYNTRFWNLIKKWRIV